MNAAETIQEAINELIDSHDVDPRCAAIHNLKGLLQKGAKLPDDVSIRLTATLQPGGKCEVADQAGRIVESVQSVAVFKDQHGRDVMQINLGE